MKCFTAKYDSATRRYLSLAVYAVFFIVHFFCIPGPASATILPAFVSDLHKISKNENSVKENHNAGHVKKIKLNISKRFQHATGPIELPVAQTLPVAYFNKNFPAGPQHYLLISHILVSSLRGPPAQA